MSDDALCGSDDLYPYVTDFDAAWATVLHLCSHRFPGWVQRWFNFLVVIDRNTWVKIVQVYGNVRLGPLTVNAGMTVPWAWCGVNWGRRVGVSWVWCMGTWGEG